MSDVNPHYVVFGAGGVGATIGARLFQAGAEVTLIARGDHAQMMQRDGLRFVWPDGQAQLMIPTVLHPRQIEWSQRCVVLLCMKSQHTQEALRALVECDLPDIAVVCVQNGVANERMALRYFSRTYATVVNLPAMFLTPGAVVTYARGAGGILDSGRFPGGVDDTVVRLTQDLTAAGFSAQPDERVMRQKYAKLLMNLANVLQAALDDVGAARDYARSMRHEALACFAAAGIDCATRQQVQERQAGVYEMAPVTGYPRTAGSSWQSLARGTGDIETEYLNGEICSLGRLHDVPTPVNQACVRLARQLLKQGGKPGQFSVDDLRRLIA